MKFFAPIVVGVIAFLSSQVDANGVCYDPNHDSGMSASTVQADMKTIAGAGFSSVRTYISKFGDTEMGPIITGAGLTAVLGVPYPQSDYQEQMEAAIKAANAGGVYAIMVGNENLAGASSVPSDMISVINQIKSRVPKGVLVGTVQRNTEVIGCHSISGWSDLVSACDLVGANAHPYFNPNTAADNAIQVLNKQWQTMAASIGSKLILTETGWPSSGTLMGNVGSLEGAEKFYNAYQQWSSSMGEKFYFQMFDTPYRSEDFEKTFGLYTSNSQPKFTMSQSPSTSSNQQQQQQQQQTPSTEAPSTNAPTEQQQTPTTDAPTEQQQTPSTDAPTNQQQTPSTDAPTNQQQSPSTEAPTYQQQTPATEAPTPAPTTAAPTPEPTTATEAPTAAPTPEATPAPTETVYQNSGSAEYNSTAGSNEVQFGSASTSSSASSGDEAGVVNGSSASTVSSKSSENEEQEQQQQQEEEEKKTSTSKTDETDQQQQQAEQTTQQTSAQKQDDTQQANTRSGSTGTSTTMAFGLAGGACAALVAFGFIYQARKRAADLESKENLSVTPMENHCAL